MRLADARSTLLEHRAGRPQPARDDKVLAGWNGLAIAALADAARVAARGRMTGAPRGAPRPLPGRRRQPRTPCSPGLVGSDGRLRRSWKDGRATADGILEDHACLADGLARPVRGDRRGALVCGDALTLVDAILGRFADPAGGFFDTADDGEPLVAAPEAPPRTTRCRRAAAMATTVLLRLAALHRRWSLPGVGDGGAARRMTDLVPGIRPRFAQWLCAMELANAGRRPRWRSSAMPGRCRHSTGCSPSRTRGYHPFRVLARSATPEASAVPLLQRPVRARRPLHRVRVPATSRAVSRSTSRRRSRRCCSKHDRDRTPR